MKEEGVPIWALVTAFLGVALVAFGLVLGAYWFRGRQDAKDQKKAVQIALKKQAVVFKRTTDVVVESEARIQHYFETDQQIALAEPPKFLTCGKTKKFQFAFWCAFDINLVTKDNTEWWAIFYDKHGTPTAIKKLPKAATIGPKA